MVLTQLPPLLLELWREQHPEGHEQTVLNFKARKSVTPSGRSNLSIKCWTEKQDSSERRTARVLLMMAEIEKAGRRGDSNPEDQQATLAETGYAVPPVWYRFRYCN